MFIDVTAPIQENRGDAEIAEITQRVERAMEVNRG